MGPKSKFNTKCGLAVGACQSSWDDITAGDEFKFIRSFKLVSCSQVGNNCFSPNHNKA